MSNIDKLIDPSNNIDSVIKRDFFVCLLRSLPCYFNDFLTARAVFYDKLVKFYWDKDNVNTERAKIEKQKKQE